MFFYYKYDVEYYKYKFSEVCVIFVFYCFGFFDLIKKIFNWIIFKKLWYFIILYVLLVL